MIIDTIIFGITNNPRITVLIKLITIVINYVFDYIMVQVQVSNQIQVSILTSNVLKCIYYNYYVLLILWIIEVFELVMVIIQYGMVY